MYKCLVCGSGNAYEGLTEAGCDTPTCRLYDPKVPPKLIRICWKVNGRFGRSRPLARMDAQKKVNIGLANFGKDTHWIEGEEP